MDYPQRPPRYPTYIPVVISQSGTAQSGHIVDLNARGACIAGISDLDSEDIIHLRGAVETSRASVRWQNNKRIGVSFERPIPPQYLAMLRLRSQAYRSGNSIPERHAV
ncbi:MAG: PilZ domain-containing protein [Pseudomonadota bacterium]